MGPCLCGDPYCPSCGNADPEMEDAIEDLCEKVSELFHADSVKWLIESLPVFKKMYDSAFDDGIGAEKEKQQMLAHMKKEIEWEREAAKAGFDPMGRYPQK